MTTVPEWAEYGIRSDEDLRIVWVDQARIDQSVRLGIDKVGATFNSLTFHVYYRSRFRKKYGPLRIARMILDD